MGIKMTQTCNRRKHERVGFAGSVSITWTAKTGSVLREKTTGLNVSTYGMLVESHVPIPVNARVLADVHEFGYSGQAMVVRCVPHGAKFGIGLHFDGVLSFYPDVKRNSLKPASK
jgi:hypothetical protein